MLKLLLLLLVPLFLGAACSFSPPSAQKSPAASVNADENIKCGQLVQERAPSNFSKVGELKYVYNIARKACLALNITTSTAASYWNGRCNLDFVYNKSPKDLKACLAKLTTSTTPLFYVAELDDMTNPDILVNYSRAEYGWPDWEGLNRSHGGRCKPGQSTESLIYPAQATWVSLPELKQETGCDGTLWPRATGIIRGYGFDIK